LDTSTLSIILKAVDNASAQIAGVATQLKALGVESEQSNAKNMTFGKSLTAMGESAGKLGSTLMMGVTLPMLAIGGASAKMAMDFQQSMTYVKTDAGDTTDDITKLSNSVLDLAKKSQFSPDELANGLYHLASLGLRGADAMNALTVAQNMAAVGGSNLEDTSTALGGALVTGIKGVQDYSSAAGTLDAIIGAGNMRMQDLVGAIGTGVLPVFKNAGLSITDFGAALATLTDNGQAADAAATHLRMTIALMEAPSGTAKKALEAIGITSTELGYKMQTEGLVPALTDLKKHLLDTYGTTAMGKEKMAAALTEMFGGGRSSAAIQTLLDQLDRVQGKYTQISQQTGEFSNKVAEQQQTASAKVKIAWDAIQADAIQIGGAILPALSSAFATLTNTISNIVAWYQKLSPAQQTVVKDLLIFIGVMGPLLFGFSKAIKIGTEVKSAVEDIGTVFVKLGGIIQKTAVFFIENPILIAVVAIAVAAYLIITHWQQISGFFEKLWGGITGFFHAAATDIMSILRSVADFFVRVWTSVINFFRPFWNVLTSIIKVAVEVWMTMLKVIINVIRYIFDVVRGIFIVAFQFIYNNVIKPYISLISIEIKAIIAVFEFIWNIITSATKAVWDFLYNNIIKPIIDLIVSGVHLMGSVIGAVFNAIKGPASDTWNFITGLWNGIVGFFSGLASGISGVFSTIAKSIGGFFSSAFDGAKNFVKGGINGLIDIANGAVHAMNNTVGKLPGVPHIGDIPHLASGTNFFQGGVALLGEQGPELAVLPQGAQVVPAQQTASMLNGSQGQPSVHLTVNVGMYAGQPGEVDNIAKAIYQGLMRVARQHGLQDALPKIGIVPQ
jgi:TP901 family phage tail tape measure protein